MWCGGLGDRAGGVGGELEGSEALQMLGPPTLRVSGTPGTQTPQPEGQPPEVSLGPDAHVEEGTASPCPPPLPAQVSVGPPPLPTSTHPERASRAWCKGLLGRQRSSPSSKNDVLTVQQNALGIPSPDRIYSGKGRGAMGQVPAWQAHGTRQR